MQYRKAHHEDIPAIAVLFLSAFTPSVRHFIGQTLNNNRSIQDIISFFLRTEPDGFNVAVDGDTVIGYLMATRNIRKLWLKALFYGDIFVWLFRWLTGRYDISASALSSVIRHKLLFLASRHNCRPFRAQILSVAIHHDYRNHGIARELLKSGLNYLGKEDVKLEVRPENKSARRLYTSYGFKPIATTSDSQGEWIVMVKKD